MAEVQVAGDAVVVMPKRRRIQRGWMAAAACLLLVVATWLVIQRQAPSHQQFVTIDNPSGSIRQIELPDHSQVWLNAGSQLQYAENFSGDRSIRLQGEAIFDVTEDKLHPFVVRAGDLQTTVLGTRFNVRSFGEEQESDITVLQGKVRVDNAGKALDVLTPARQLQWDRQQQAFKTLTVDTAVVTAWQQGKLQFNGQTMDVIAGVLARWYKMRFTFRDSSVRYCRAYAQFKSDTPLTEVLASMSLVLDFKYIIDDKQRIVTLYGKGCVPSPK
jgi:ferric-dicitrate binding protein FerR (iron transport regulator)